MAQQLSSDKLRDNVTAVVRKHWLAPRSADNPQPVPADRVEEVSRAALDAMLTRPFRVGPLPAPGIYEQMLERVRRKVSRNQKIFVTVGFGPLKNPNVVPYSRADWAEFFALCHLVAWHNKVQGIYAPGLQIRIVFDDSTLVMANHADRGMMKSYMTSVQSLTRTLGFEAIFLPTVGHSVFAWLFHLGLYQIARWRVRRWERNPANREQLDRMNEFARRNVLLPPGLSPEKQTDYFRACSHRYRVYWEALQLSGFTRTKSRLVAMYLDGSQHHIPQAVAFHLTSVDKGQVTQPWQGEGVLLDNDHGGLVPFVLTGGRRQRYTMQMVDGLNLVPGEGFGRIAVVRAMGTATKESVAESTPTEAMVPPPA